MNITEAKRLRIEQVRAIVEQHYEPGRQDKNLKWVWRTHVRPVYGIGYITFLGYLKGCSPARITRDDD